jgi:hypothetical protein
VIVLFITVADELSEEFSLSEVVFVTEVTVVVLPSSLLLFVVVFAPEVAVVFVVFPPPQAVKISVLSKRVENRIRFFFI